MKLAEVLVLRRASIYSSPGNGNDILQKVYGDLTDGEAGTVGCVEIQTWNGSSQVYQIADHAIRDFPPNVFVDNVLTGSGYTFSAATDFEGQGAVAILTFDNDQTGRQISVQCKGKENGAGGLIENRAEIIYDIAVTTHGLGVDEWNGPKYTEAFQR